jgi:hypothetical protein
MTDHALFLEILNGAAVTPELICLAMLAVYLCRESRRRGLHALDWFRLPPSMNLVLAMFIFDAGVWLRSLTIWIWRRFFGAGDFSAVQTSILIIGGALIVVGSLCKVRALTHPDHGAVPWFASAYVTAVAIVVLLLFR